MKDGGPAFPGNVYNLTEDGSEQVGEHTFRVPGMSLRDWFAGQALQGAISWYLHAATQGVTRNQREDTPTVMAGMAYQLADEMLAVRDSQQFISDRKEEGIGKGT